MKRPIAIGLAPNMETDDVILSFKEIVNPFRYKRRGPDQKLKKEFERYFGKEYEAFLTKSGRGALYIILDSLKIGKGDEVIVQAFTCSAAINPILWVGAKPVYVDIDKTYNIDPTKIEAKISNKTKAIIVQHTFGIPSDVIKIKKLAKKHNLYLIEDCAVSLGAQVSGKMVGEFGDISFFSFGRDKVISSVWGGAILTSNKRLINLVSKSYAKIEYPSSYWIFQQLLHPIAFLLILPLYQFGLGKYTLGKIFLFVIQKLNLLSLPVSEIEKDSKMPSDIPQRLPGAISLLTKNQLKKVDRFNNKRKNIAKIYRQKLKLKNIKHPPNIDGSIWLRYPLEINNALSLLEFAKERGVILGDWYKQALYPSNDLKKMKYFSDCKNVEALKNKVVNLPTYSTMTEEDVEVVINLVIAWQQSQQKK